MQMEHLKIQREGHVLIMTLDRKDKMNAFTPGMLHSLSEAFTWMEDNPEIRCGVLVAEGDHFTSGLDLEKVGPEVMNGKPLFGENKVDPVRTVGRHKTKPVVMAVKGYCLTVGVELILANDIAIAGENTLFGQIEIKRGIFPFGGATVRMPQRCGWGNAMRYLLTGDLFDAREALRIGLIQEITPHSPEDRAIELAGIIASQAPLGVYATLKSAYKSLHNESEALRDLVPAAMTLMQSSDAREGMMSFIERRSAKFTGE